MRPNCPIVAVLLAAFVLAAGVVGAASLREGEPGPEDVAIRVDGVEVTFAELELRRDAGLAAASVMQRLVDGEDFGLPPESFEQMRLFRDLFAPLRQAEDPAAFVTNAVAAAAARADALQAGLSEEAVAARLEITLQSHEVIMEPEAEALAFPREMREAQIAAVGEKRFVEDYLLLQARDGLAREILAEGMDLEPQEMGVVLMTLALRSADDADIWLHPSLDVSEEQVRESLRLQIAQQEAVARLSELLIEDSPAIDD